MPFNFGEIFIQAFEHSQTKCDLLILFHELNKGEEGLVMMIASSLWCDQGFNDFASRYVGQGFVGLTKVETVKLQ